VYHILGIVRSQIEIKNIFSLVGILINLCQCKLQTDNLERLIFVNKNWLNNLRYGYKTSNNMEKAFELEANLVK
jgi:hypothetical protein